jgi:hypothetical protein
LGPAAGFQAPLVPGRVIVVLASPDAPEEELPRLSEDVVLVRSVSEYRLAASFAPDCVLVLASGLELANDLLQQGTLDPASRIAWALSPSVPENLARLTGANLATETAVCGYLVLDHNLALVTANGAGPPNSGGPEGRGPAGESNQGLDGEAFALGLKLADLAAALDRDLSGVDQQTALLQELQTKHIDLLQALDAGAGSIAGVAAPLGRGQAMDAGAAEAKIDTLQKELAQLKKKYDRLDRRYKALANSRMGKLTLKLWERKRISLTPTRKAAKASVANEPAKASPAAKAGKA